MNKPPTALECAHLSMDDLVNQIWACNNEDEAATIIEAYVQQRCAALVEAVQKAKELISYHGQDMQPKAVAECNLNAAFKILGTALAQFKGEKVDE